MRRHLAAVLAATLLLAGCARTDPGTPTADSAAMPDDFGGTIEYANGSVAPPYHYEWVLRITEDTAELTWRPGYDKGGPSWRESAPIGREQRERLYERLREAGALDPSPAEDEGMVGGSTGSVELVAGGRTYDPGTLGLSRESQDILDEVSAAAEDLLPGDVWSSMRDKQEAWGEENPD
ncbi:MAG: hypothetical protein GEV28_26475 [Actinophytocola sp.]|uniref:hypothetical protein n=1 Tax=Actinophytocola sp. TaxID=1872138 RepID=UPI001328575B|nr:hypothetical protein [Actinophytocola sp.]MPZ83746.1 hypothetical protein [Actinophytocola sp.]